MFKVIKLWLNWVFNYVLNNKIVQNRLSKFSDHLYEVRKDINLTMDENFEFRGYKNISPMLLYAKIDAEVLFLYDWYIDVCRDSEYSKHFLKKINALIKLSNKISGKLKPKISWNEFKLKFENMIEFKTYLFRECETHGRVKVPIIHKFPASLCPDCGKPLKYRRGNKYTYKIIGKNGYKNQVIYMAKYHCENLHIHEVELNENESVKTIMPTTCPKCNKQLKYVAIEINHRIGVNKRLKDGLKDTADILKQMPKIRGMPKHPEDD